MAVLYVSPAGQDTNEGTAKFPFATVSRALQQARPGGVIQLAPGTYQANEQFPLQVPAGVTLAGDATRQAKIAGGGAAGHRHAAVVLGDRAQLRDLTVTNPNGTGVITGAGAALIIRSRIVDCQQYGLLASGDAMPFISENEFIGNGDTGLVMVDQAKGEIRQNRFSQSENGLSMRSRSAPLVTGNQFSQNRHGIVITAFARPVLRQNAVTQSAQVGLWIQDRAQPDIGLPQDLGENEFQGDRYDVLNDASAPLPTAGNQINPLRVSGQIAYLPSEIPDPIAVPDVLLGQRDLPPAPPETPPSTPSDEPLSLDSQFVDVVGHWAAPFIEVLAQKNLVRGFLNGTFRPDDQVTRAQFAALIAAAFPDVPDLRATRQFVDVASDYWGANAIQQAQMRGFISGFPDGTFRPNAPMTRVQALVALVNGLELGQGRSEALLIYADRAQVPSYAIEPVAAATNRQLVVGYPDPYQLRPLAPITRAETAAFVHQALVANGQLSAIASPFIPSPATEGATFSDLSTRHWATDFINPLVRKGWLSGFRDGTFRPDAPMTRAQFAVLLVGAFDPAPKRSAIAFRDVPDSFWGAAVIQQAYRAGFLSGFPDLTFDPNFPLTKLQAILALVSGLSLREQAPPRSAALQAYRDADTIPAYARDAVATATQLSLIFNHPVVSELRPNRTATRAEVSAMVYQALVLEDRLPPLSSRYQVLSTLSLERSR